MVVWGKKYEPFSMLLDGGVRLLHITVVSASHPLNASLPIFVQQDMSIVVSVLHS